MATTKRRLNITLNPILEKTITLLAKRDGVPEATKAAELLTKAIEVEEDALLLEIAMRRDTKNAKYVSHNDFWS